MADVATVLFCNHLKFDASAPEWADRDRFVLSAGHGSMLIYALLHLSGYKDMTIEQIKNFRNGVRGRHADDLYGLQMGLVSNTMTDDQAIEDMVAYITTLGKNLEAPVKLAQQR